MLITSIVCKRIKLRLPFLTLALGMSLFVLYAGNAIAQEEECPSSNVTEIPLNARLNCVTGNDGPNTLRGSNNPKVLDDIRGLGGNDTLKGLRGRDGIEGNGGSDTIYGGDGADGLFGDHADPTSPLGSGRLGRDKLYGGRGNDIVFAHDGKRDIVSCGPGKDKVNADKHKDRVAKDCEIKKFNRCAFDNNCDSVHWWRRFLRRR